MQWLKRSRETLPSERGFLELVGREPEVAPRELFLKFRDLVSSHMDWADSRKRRFRTRASLVQVIILVFTGASTVILGISAIPNAASWALPLVATVTMLGGLEAFFNWRSRWILMEETQYRLNRIRDELDYYIATTPSSQIKASGLERFYSDEQAVWDDVSRRWLQFRRTERPSYNESKLSPER